MGSVDMCVDQNSLVVFFFSLVCGSGATMDQSKTSQKSGSGATKDQGKIYGIKLLSELLLYG